MAQHSCSKQWADAAFCDCRGSVWEQMTDGWYYQGEQNTSCFNLLFVQPLLRG